MFAGATRVASAPATRAATATRVAVKRMSSRSDEELERQVVSCTKPRMVLAFYERREGAVDLLSVLAEMLSHRAEMLSFCQQILMII